MKGSKIIQNQDNQLNTTHFFLINLRHTFRQTLEKSGKQDGTVNFNPLSFLYTKSCDFLAKKFSETESSSLADLSFFSNLVRERYKILSPVYFTKNRFRIRKKKKNLKEEDLENSREKLPCI